MKKPNKDSDENNAEKAEAEKRNRNLHTLNGNRTHYKILQINSSNADFNSKLIELEDTINENKSEIILISESNADVGDQKKMLERSKKFANYNLKTNSSRVTVKPEIQL